MSLQEKIMEYMQTKAKRPMSQEDLLYALALEADEIKQLPSVMEELERKNLLIQNRSGLFGLPKHMNLVIGKMSITAKGFGFVIPDNGLEEGKAKVDDIFIPAGMLNSAMNNDKVLVRITTERSSFTKREGEVIRILERANNKVVGTFESSRTFGFVVPDDSRLNQDIFIEGRNFNGAKVGMKVVAEITKWPTKNHSPGGKIIEVLGKIGAPGVDILSVMRQYDLSEQFPVDVQEEAKQIEQVPSKSECNKRKDRRHLQIVTIDGEDAKDLDDGVYAEKLPNGNFFLGVYIADVSHYVKAFSPLDKEAYNRGTSVYLADRVIPMLPVELSNGICSLNAGEDRLSMCAEMEIDANGSVIKYDIFPTVIHVYRRLTYKLVNRILVEKDTQMIEDNQDILPLLHNLEAVYKVLNKRRQMRGAIDFDIPEVKVKLNAKGQAVGLVKREHGLGESIIEECMLVANETVAEHMARKELPFIYRVHEEPVEDKMFALNELLANFNLHLNRNTEGEVEPRAVQEVLNSIKGKPEEKIISAVALRSMQQAKYKAENLGHFGLAAKYYTHFTSPIRRYPDLIVHRLLKEQLNGKMTAERQEKLKSRLPEVATHTSKQERVATEAERETTLIKEIEYMARFLGDEFHGIISGVTAFGIFVELDNGVEGLVHVSTMVNDYYEYVEKEYALVGEMTNFRYRLGDEVTVILTRASIKERSIDFILKDNGKMPLVFEDDIIAKPFFTEINNNHHRRRLDKHRSAAGGGVMHQTGHLAPVLRLYRHYKAPTTLGDDGLLQEFLVMGGVDHTVQPLPNGRRLGLNLPTNVVKLFRCLVRHFLRTDNAGKNPILQIFVHRNAVKKEIQRRACARQMAVPVVQNAQRPQGVTHLQQFRHIQAPAGCRPLQRTVYIMQPAKRRRAEPGQHRKSAPIRH